MRLLLDHLNTPRATPQVKHKKYKYAAARRSLEEQEAAPVEAPEPMRAH